MLRWVQGGTTLNIRTWDLPLHRHTSTPQAGLRTEHRDLIHSLERRAGRTAPTPPVAGFGVGCELISVCLNWRPVRCPPDSSPPASPLWGCQNSRTSVRLGTPAGFFPKIPSTEHGSEPLMDTCGRIIRLGGGGAALSTSSPNLTLVLDHQTPHASPLSVSEARATQSHPHAARLGVRQGRPVTGRWGFLAPLLARHLGSAVWQWT